MVIDYQLYVYVNFLINNRAIKPNIFIYGIDYVHCILTKTIFIADYLKVRMLLHK